MSRQLVFLHIIDTTGPGGAETIFTQLANETAVSGHRTIAVIRGRGWVHSELARLGIETVILNCKGSFNVVFLKNIIKIIKAENVTCIQSHLLGSNVYASLAGFLCNIPVISTFHGFVDISSSERYKWLKFFIVGLGSKKIVAVTEQIKEMLSKIPAIASDKVVVISNGIDTNIFKPFEIKQSAYRSPIVIGCLGNVRKAKNYPLAINVIKKLVDQGYDVELKVAGDAGNKLAEECKTLAQSLNIAERVSFIGFIADAPKYLNEIDIYLLSSSSEGHPLALTQAMACALPIVATKCGIEGVVQDNLTALLAENGNVDSICKNIITFIDFPELGRKLGNAALDEVFARWSYSVMIEKYKPLLGY